MLKYLLLLSLLSWSLIVSATTFVPQTIKDQLVESSGIVVGEVISIRSEQEPDGRIYSMAFIKADKWLGADVKSDHIEVYFPGGKVGDLVSKIEGAPKFNTGEKVVLFTKNIQNKSYVLNLGMGKFSIKNLGKTQIMVNQIFPQTPEVGQMKLKNFYQLARNLKGKKFSERFKNKYELNIEKQTNIQKSKRVGRKIASVSEKEQDKNKVPVYWLVILLGIVGCSYSFLRKRSSDK